MRPLALAPILIAGVLAATLASRAQTLPADAPAEPPDVVRHVYDVRDLLTDFPHFPADGSLLPPTDLDGRPFRAATPDGSAIDVLGTRVPMVAPVEPSDWGKPDPTCMPMEGRMDDVIQLVVSTVDRSGWTDNGGSNGSIKSLNHYLIVSQTPANQAAVADLLEKLRDVDDGLTLDAAWATAPAADLAKAEKAGTLGDFLDKLDPPPARGRIACLNGQIVTLAAGPALPVGPGSAFLTAPGVRLAQAGAFLECRAVLIPSAKTGKSTAAYFFARSVLSRFVTDAAPSTRPASARPPVSAVTLATAARVPLGQWTVIGGLTPDATADTPDAAQVYLIVRVTRNSK